MLSRHDLFRSWEYGCFSSSSWRWFFHQHTPRLHTAVVETLSLSPAKEFRSKEAQLIKPSFEITFPTLRLSSKDGSAIFSELENPFQQHFVYQEGMLTASMPSEQMYSWTFMWSG